MKLHLLAVCAAAVLAVGGCVANSAPIEGEPESEGQVAEALGIDGADDEGAPAGGRTSVDAKRSKAIPGNVEVTSSPYDEQSDPDPEPWHGGKTGTSSNPGKHD